MAGCCVKYDWDILVLFFFFNFQPFSFPQMVVTDVYNHKFHKIFNFDEGVNPILDRDDIFMYVSFFEFVIKY